MMTSPLTLRVKLYVDETSVQYVGGAQIDYENSLMGGGFRILNPNAVRSCAAVTPSTQAQTQAMPRAAAALII